MDAVFAILVLGAVIFFGALISAGNERQRKALEGIREQAAQWAVQDLRLKREKLAREVKVDDPLAWLNQVVAKVYGENMDLAVTEVFDNPQALVCTAKDGRKVVFSPIPPRDSKNFFHRRSKVARMGTGHPLQGIPRSTRVLEMSILTCGAFFDLELPLAWNNLCGDATRLVERLWLYCA